MRVCDSDGDGNLDFAEFVVHYGPSNSKSSSFFHMHCSLFCSSFPCVRSRSHSRAICSVSFTRDLFCFVLFFVQAA